MDEMSYTNRSSFSTLCRGSFGRKVIYTNAIAINEANIVKELGKAISVHSKNKVLINYLDRYYSGDQPINYRVKPIRPEINNLVCENHALEIVEHKTAELFGEPIQYVLKTSKESEADSNGKGMSKNVQIELLNKFMADVDKGAEDISLGRWRSICGTSYRYIWDEENSSEDEAPFGIETCDPRDTFVVYFSGPGKRPAFSCQIRMDEDDQKYYFVYTDAQNFIIKNGVVTGGNKSGLNINGYGMIPVIEYPNNERRMSDIEIVISMLDTLNKMQSDRMNGIEQFIQALMKFKNCEVDDKEYDKMRAVGVIKIKAGIGTDADVSLMTAELDQSQTQTAKDDLYQNVLLIEGMPGRQENSGGDTGQAVVLRNGHYDAEKRAELSEPIFKKSERQFLRAVTRMLKTGEHIKNLTLGDIEIKITRSKMDNMAVKAQVAQVLLKAGYAPHLVTKVCNLFSDPEGAYVESKPFLDALYLTLDQMNEKQAEERAYEAEKLKVQQEIQQDTQKENITTVNGAAE